MLMSLIHIKALMNVLKMTECSLILKGCRSDSFLISQPFWRQHLNCPGRRHCFIPPGLSLSEPGKPDNQIQAHSIGKKRCTWWRNECSGLTLLWSKVRGYWCTSVRAQEANPCLFICSAYRPPAEQTGRLKLWPKALTSFNLGIRSKYPQKENTWLQIWL